uniref:Fungal lipase-type domain-containing protein n=1 Tax=Chromera velia CCMP2878 TaxID=1169474 RepID=A0A0G4F2V8_9ALVE|eukprot:Cvel_14714.t1-p1 / transcript=Cvel_14714.t1 / gene=Cvel_14714 / organism=Chromera_velia_CCMP2878 / gene_product=hypothetical protein / transcript_product=hypothetical protein / location=Cvel_scaffold1057:33346-44753(+) / protein_length=803 / sequence_SO=supercontig / SO=protein_coding / is_pseudo=false
MERRAQIFPSPFQALLSLSFLFATGSAFTPDAFSKEIQVREAPNQGSSSVVVREYAFPSDLPGFYKELNYTCEKGITTQPDNLGTFFGCLLPSIDEGNSLLAATCACTSLVPDAEACGIHSFVQATVACGDRLDFVCPLHPTVIPALRVSEEDATFDSFDFDAALPVPSFLGRDQTVEEALPLYLGTMAVYRLHAFAVNVVCFEWADWESFEVLPGWELRGLLYPRFRAAPGPEQPQIALSVRGDTLLITIRGTQHYAEWLSDFRWDLRPDGVHRGFGDVADALLPSLVQLVEEILLQEGGSLNKAVVTGHSLGGALTDALSLSLVETFGTLKWAFLSYEGVLAFNQEKYNEQAEKALVRHIRHHQDFFVDIGCLGCGPGRQSGGRAACGAETQAPFPSLTEDPSPYGVPSGHVNIRQGGPTAFDIPWKLQPLVRVSTTYIHYCAPACFLQTLLEKAVPELTVTPIYKESKQGNFTFIETDGRFCTQGSCNLLAAQATEGAFGTAIFGIFAGMALLLPGTSARLLKLFGDQWKEKVNAADAVDIFGKLRIYRNGDWEKLSGGGLGEKGGEEEDVQFHFDLLASKGEEVEWRRRQLGGLFDFSSFDFSSLSMKNDKPSGGGRGFESGGEEGGDKATFGFLEGLSSAFWASEEGEGSKTGSESMATGKGGGKDMNGAVPSWRTMGSAQEYFDVAAESWYTTTFEDTCDGKYDGDGLAMMVEKGPEEAWRQGMNTLFSLQTAIPSDPQGQGRTEKLLWETRAKEESNPDTFREIIGKLTRLPQDAPDPEKVSQSVREEGNDRGGSK